MDRRRNRDNFVQRPKYSPIVLNPSRDYLTEYLTLVSGREWIGETADFRFISYNVLADYCLSENPRLYSHCPPQCLDINRRAEFIAAELRLLNPTILCLQEVDEGLSLYYDTVKDAQWLYKKRSQPSKKDGVAIVFDNSAFELVFSADIEYCTTEVFRLDRPNVGLLALLRSRTQPNRAVLVGNTHLLFNFKRGDIQLSQLIIFFASLKDCLDRYKDIYEISVLLGGDYNFSPSSALYKFVVEGELDVSSVSMVNLADRNACDTAEVGVGPNISRRVLRRYEYQAHLRHRGDASLGYELYCLGAELKGTKYLPALLDIQKPEFVLHYEPNVQSAYFTATSSECFPAAYIDGVLDCPDYIWYGGTVRVTGVLLPPPISTMLQSPGLPSDLFPSDHVCLAANFAWN